MRIRQIAASLCCALVAVLCVGCGRSENIDWLAYQRSALSVRGLFDLNGEELEALVELEAPEFDDDGRMLARRARVTLDGNSIIAGVAFELDRGRVYLTSGVLKLPLEDEALIDGINAMISLFCVSSDSFTSAAPTELDGVKCVRALYEEGENSVELYIDPDTLLPIKLTAALGEERLSVDIHEISVE